METLKTVALPARDSFKQDYMRQASGGRGSAATFEVSRNRVVLLPNAPGRFGIYRRLSAPSGIFWR
jgi:hypothetical protein